jgi:beta-lactamase class D OXA-1
MIKIFVALIMLAFGTGLYANTSNLSQYFTEKTGCFILYNSSQNTLVTKYNAEQCKKQIAPQSTFKIPLSLMAFDQSLITQKTVFKWDGEDRGKPQWNWNHNQTPKTWLSNSVVWVSQEITPKLGMKKIKHYLSAFNYGNENFSGDAGKNNGLEKAWLNSSLKISGDEQLSFLKNFAAGKLPLSPAALNNTKQNMYLETSPEGWKLYGKTGTGVTPTIGWFVGFIEKSGKTYIFVTNLTEQGEDVQVSGIKAKEITKQILTAMGIF